MLQCWCGRRELNARCNPCVRQSGGDRPIAGCRGAAPIPPTDGCGRDSGGVAYRDHHGIARRGSARGLAAGRAGIIRGDGISAGRAAGRPGRAGACRGARPRRPPGLNQSPEPAAPAAPAEALPRNDAGAPAERRPPVAPLPFPRARRSGAHRRRHPGEHRRRRVPPGIRIASGCACRTGAGPVAAACHAPCAAASEAALGWRAALAAWLRAHKTYPEAARRGGEEGRVVVRFTVARDGQVLDVQLASSSGYSRAGSGRHRHAAGRALAAAAHRDAEAEITATVPIRYELEP